MLGRLLQDIRPEKFLNNALMPDGALALFGIFAGHISCNKRPHSRYLLLHFKYVYVKTFHCV